MEQNPIVWQIVSGALFLLTTVFTGLWKKVGKLLAKVKEKLPLLKEAADETVEAVEAAKDVPIQAIELVEKTLSLAEDGNLSAEDIKEIKKEAADVKDAAQKFKKEFTEAKEKWVSLFKKAEG